MDRHAIIGANIMDRLVKCPGSLVAGKGSLAEYDDMVKNKGQKNKYVKNKIECNEATTRGEKIDELAKNFMRWKYGVPEKRVYTHGDDELNPELVEPARAYYEHIYKVRQRFAKGNIDPGFDLSRFMTALPNCEFRVKFNPDFVAHNEYKGIVFVSDLTTGQSTARNKMFQVLCCAVGIITNCPDVTACVCEVFNAITGEVQLSRFSREELEAYRDDIIFPALDRVKSALVSTDIEQYRHNCSWCDHFCKCKDSGCQACHSVEAESENEVPVQLHFFTSLITDDDRKQYAEMFA